MRFLHPRFNGQGLLVPEDCLTFGYCILPENLPKESWPLQEKSQEFCGRGLEVTQHIAKGEVIFKAQCRPIYIVYYIYVLHLYI